VTSSSGSQDEEEGDEAQEDNDDGGLNNIRPKKNTQDRYRRYRNKRYVNSRKKTSDRPLRTGDRSSRNTNYSQENQQDDTSCWNCGKSGHYSRQCPEKRSRNRGNSRRQ
jgi:hypothetical protein